jgi:hypothetical protein
MSGIYIEFAPEGLSAERRDRFDRRLAERVTRIPGEPLDRLDGTICCGAVTHHGVLPSGGAARDGETLLLSCGSCWLDPKDEAFATPAAILAAWNARDGAGQRPFGGVFLLAHCDETRRTLTVETDRFGNVPLYYRRVGRGLALASELKFLVDPGREKLDLEAAAEMLVLGYISRPHSLIRGIRRLPPHHRLICTADGCRTEPLPIPGYPRDRVLDREAIAEYDRIIRRSLGRFHGLADRFSLSLSGGLDSRILAAIAKQSGLRVAAFTVGEPGSQDTHVARQVADRLEIPVSVHEVRGRNMPQWFAQMVWLTEGRVLPGHMHYMTVNFNREVAPGPQLHGLIGETHLGGLFEDLDLVGANPERITAACRAFAHAKAMNYWPTGTRTELLSAATRAEMDATVEKSIDYFADQIDFCGTYADMVEFKLRLRIKAFTIPNLLSQVLPWTDIASPFLDADAYDYAANFRAEDLAHRRGQIAWGLQTMPVITELPRVKDGVTIPVTTDDVGAFDREITRYMRRIQMVHYVCRLTRGRVNLPVSRSFPVYGQWYRKYREVRAYVDSVLLSPQCLDRGLVTRSGMRRLLRMLRIGHNLWPAVGTLLLIELCMRQLADGTDIPENPTVPWGA